jgi:drug/metabolite transporter (DMT)-like permease
MRNLSNNIIFIIGSAILLIGSNVVYHVCQKSIPTEVNPVVSIIFTFFIALLISILLLPIFVDTRDVPRNIRNINWANILSGISIVGIVIGHVLYYRSGWSLSTGTLFSYVTICILLIPIGLIIFRERINFYNLAGIIIALLGLYLLTKK